MDKFRSWFNKPKRAFENQQMIRPLTLDVKRHVGSDSAVVTETLSPADQLLDSLLLDIKHLDRDLVNRFIMQDSDPDLLVITRLGLLRDLLQGPRCWTPPSPQVERLPSEKKLLSGPSPGARDPLGPTWRPGVTGLRASRDTASLPSSPHPRWRRRAGRGGRRLSGSLPGSPLLGERPSSFPAPPSASSRLWVEAALQRSKNPTRATTPPQVREGGRTPQSPVQLPDVEGGDEEALGWWTSESFRYCLLTPCVCCRCPSAPPFEDSPTSGPDHPGVAGGRGSPPLGRRPKLYPSLRLWGITGDPQNDVADGVAQLQRTSDEAGKDQTPNSADISEFMNTVFDFQTAEPEKL